MVESQPPVEGVGQLVLDDGLLDGGGGGVADGEVEGGGGVALDAVLREVRRSVGAGRVGGAVPCETVALIGQSVASGGGPDIEVQYPQGVAAVGGGLQHVGMEAGVGSSVGGALEGVCLVVADGVRDGVVVGRHGIQVHVDGAVLAVGGGEEERIVATVGHGDTLPNDGKKIVANGAV